MTRLALDHVTKRFGTTVAVDDLSLEIEDGELFFLLGPSGCGKTTVLRLIAGFERPDSGRVLFDGLDVTALPVERRHLGIVFQQYALWPHMTVEGNITFGLEMKKLPPKERKRRVEETLEKVRLPGLGARYPHELSGGQQQRVALGRALALEPGMILFDEPLSNLDPGLRVEIRDELRDLHRELRITMVYVTHDQEEALAMSDRAAVMKSGRFAQLAHPRSLYDRPANAFIASFLGDANLVRGTIGEGALLDADGAIFKLSSMPLEKGPGESGVWLIRPERLSLGGSPAPGEETIEGEVRAVTFLGPVTLVEIAIHPRLALRALERSPLPPHVAPGRRLLVRYSPNDVVFIPGEG